MFVEATVRQVPRMNFVDLGVSNNDKVKLDIKNIHAGFVRFDVVSVNGLFQVITEHNANRTMPIKKFFSIFRLDEEVN